MDTEVANMAQQGKAKRPPERNLQGQILGRKGQETRERILLAALRLIESSADSTITLSAVAREVSVRMPNLYLYFPDLGELVLACLNRVMASANASYMDRMFVRWPDERLEESVLDFLRAHYQFWHSHMRILHLRNSFADAGDTRFLEYRQGVSRPLMDALILQMDGRIEDLNSRCADVATVIMTTFERLATVMTKGAFHFNVMRSGILDEPAYIQRLMVAESEIITLAIRHQRAATRTGR